MEAKHDEAQADQKNNEEGGKAKDNNQEKTTEAKHEVVPVGPKDVGSQKRGTEAAAEGECAKKQKTRTVGPVVHENQKRDADEGQEENARRTRAKTKTRLDERSDKRERAATEEGQVSTRARTKN